MQLKCDPMKLSSVAVKSVVCEKLIRIRKVIIEDYGSCQSITKPSISIAHEPYFLIQEAGSRKKNCIIAVYLHNPAPLKAGEPPSDLKISMLSPSVSLLSFRKTGKCADI